MRVSDVLTLYDYNAWANGRVLDAAAKVPVAQFVAPAELSFDSLRGTLVHTLDAELDWRCRWQGLPSPPRLQQEDFADAGALVARWREEDARLRAYLATLRDEDLHRDLHYTSRLGRQYVETLWYLLVHVVNHGTQHRSEAAILLTNYGHSPDDLDLVYFIRDRVGAGAAQGRTEASE